MNPKPCIVVDTNALVSRLLTPHSTTARAVNAALQRYRLLFSFITYAELDEVLRRPKFDAYVSLGIRLDYAEAIADNASIIMVQETFHHCRDPRDNKFLDLAVQGNARVIISGDEDLQALHPFLGINILSPAAFLQDYGI